MFADPKYLSRGKDSTVQQLSFKKDGKKISIVCKSMRAENFNSEVNKLVGHNHPQLEKILHIWHYNLGNVVVLFCEQIEKTLNKVKIESFEHELSIAQQVLSGLEYLHLNLELAHCDLKENNIMADAEGKRVKIIDFNNCMPKKAFGRFELGVVLAKKHMDLLVNPKNWDWKVDFWALGCTIFQVKHKADILDEFLKQSNVDYATLDNSKYNDQHQKTRICLYNFYLRKIKQFKQTEQIVYACLKSSSCSMLAQYFERIRDFHQLPAPAEC